MSTVERSEKSITLYNGKAYGHKVSEYALNNGYLDYHTLSKIVGDMVLNNNIIEKFADSYWELENGWNDDVDDDEYTVYQWYIISDHGAQFLKENTDEIVYYNEDLDMYLWGITHYGTAWDYVLTDIKIHIVLEGC